jgi:hypothetical protein
VSALAPFAQDSIVSQGRTPLWETPKRWYASGIVAALGALSPFHGRLFSSAATPAVEFASDRAAAPAQDLGNLRERFIRFHEAVDLVSFIWLKCLYIGQLRLGG